MFLSTLNLTGEMVGDHCAVWIADAVLKGLISTHDPLLLGPTSTHQCPNNNHIGISQVDTEDNTNAITTGAESHGALYYTLKNALFTPVSHYEYAHSRGRRALDSHLKYGYIPLEDLILESPHPMQQVSRSLEYAYDDFVLAQLLQYVMEKDSERLSQTEWDTKGWQVDHSASSLTGADSSVDSSVSASPMAFHQATLDTLREHSTYYKNVIDTSVGFIRGRHANGTFTCPDTFDPTVYYKWITETNVWQYTWFVPHDVESMMELYGGSASFANKLNTFFDKGYYNHGNEPDHHAVYLSAYIAHSGDEVSILNNFKSVKLQFI